MVFYYEGEVDMSAPVIRIMIVDDHAVVRQGLSFLLSVYDDFTFAGEASSGKEAVALCEVLQPDVILMDLMMPEMNGIEATRRIRQRFPRVRVIALTSLVDPSLKQLAFEAGVDGFVLKTSTIDDVVDAIYAAVETRVS
jgi:two-component system, NarL family, response regulator LiaR